MPLERNETVNDEPSRPVAGVAGIARRLRALRGRKDDDDEGPFFAREAASTADADASGPRPRPRPRPRPSSDGPTEPPAAGAPAPGPRARPRPRPGGNPSTEVAAEPDRTADPTGAGEKADPDPGGGRADTAAEVTAGTSAAAKDTADSKDEPPRKRRSWRGVLRASKGRRRVVKVVILVVVVVAAALSLRTYVVAPYYIPSQSMEPALHGCPGCSDDDHVLVDKLSYRFHDPHAGDIVVFDKPAKLDEADPVLIKRVVGVGGDLLVLKHGLVYVNGKRISEPYINKSCGPHPSTPLTSRTRWQIPTDDVFVMGDNRCDSTDSRYFGPIPDSSIVGRAFVIVWPLKRFTFL